jgi:cell shape-determining protein MreC
MKVQSRHNSSKKRRYQIVLIAVLFVVMGLFLPKIISSVASVLLYPVHSTSAWLNESSSLVPSFVRERISLANQIKDLENELVKAGRIDVTQERLVEENIQLRSLLGINTEERTAAAIIARPDELPYDLLQIDRGSNHGIEVGAPVFIGRDIVLGLVVHTAPNYSFVELITTPEFRATAFISGPDVVVNMEGLGGGVARVLVPQGVPMSVGNLVYLPSVEPGVFGRISYVENRPTQPQQYGYITPEIPISGLHRVAVGKLSQISQSAEIIDERIIELIRNKLQVPDVSVGTTSSSSRLDGAQAGVAEE